MKNKKLLVAIARLLKIDENVITEASEKEDGDDSLVKSYTDKYQAYTAEELATKLKNSNRAYLETADFDINDVPKGLYNKITAATLEKKEKAIAKEHGIEQYNDFADLIGKVAALKSGKGPDVKQYTDQIDTLKQTIQKLEGEKANEIQSVHDQYTGQFIQHDLSAALKSLQFDCDADAIEKQQKIVGSAFAHDYKLSRKENKTIVFGTDGKPMVDKLGEPRSVSDVMNEFAVSSGFKLKEPDTGGRGAAGSPPKDKSNLVGKTWNEVVRDSGVKQSTEAGDKLYAEWQAANKTT